MEFITQRIALQSFVHDNSYESLSILKKNNYKQFIFYYQHHPIPDPQYMLHKEMNTHVCVHVTVGVGSCITEKIQYNS